MDQSMTVDADAESEKLCESALAASVVDTPEELLLEDGRPRTCSTLTSVLACARGGVALSPRRAKLIVRDIRGGLLDAEAFNAGFLGAVIWDGAGSLGPSMFRGAGSPALRLRSFDMVSCSRRRRTDLAERRSCAPEPCTSGSLGRFCFVGWRRCRRLGKGENTASS